MTFLDRILRPTAPLDIALRFAERGCYVFPVKDKKGDTPNGHLNATRDEATIRAWDWTDAKVGTYCRASGFIALDIDPRNGGDTSLAAMEKRFGPVPRDCVQTTFSGGQHILMRDPAPGPDGWTRTHETGGSCRGKFGDEFEKAFGCEYPGIDVKCNGLIVVYDPNLDPRGAPPVPDAWIPVLRKPTTAVTADDIGGDAIEAWATSTDPSPLSPEEAAALEAELTALGPRGAGGSTTYKAISRIFHYEGLSLEQGKPFVLRWNERNGNPYDARGLERQIRRVAERVAQRIDSGELNVSRGDTRSNRAAMAGVHSVLALPPIVSAPAPGAGAFPFQPAAAPDTPRVYGGDLREFLGAEDPGDDADAWLVHGVVAAGVPQFIVGAPKSRKTWVMEHLGISIAAGLKWLGRFDTTRGRVLMLPREDAGRETRRRTWRLCRGLGLDPRDLHEWLRIDSLTPFYFDDRADVDAMRRTIESYRPNLILLDSLSRTHRGDENSKKEMNVVTSTWSDLCQQYGVAISIVHHQPKNGEGTLIQRIRGSGDLGALVRHAVGVEKKDETTSELEFDGNLHPLPEPFLVSFRDGVDERDRKCVRLEHHGEAAAAARGKIDEGILRALESVAPGGLSATDLEKEVEGKGTTIRDRRNALVKQRAVELIGKRYHLVRRAG